MGLDQYVIKLTNNREEKTLASFRKVNILQGFFERHFNIINCIPTEIDEDTAEYLVEITDMFLDNISDNLKEEQIDDYWNKKGQYGNLTKKFLEEIENNETLQDIVYKKLPITEGFFYGIYDLDISYYLDIIKINKTFKEILKEYDRLEDNQKIVYLCWY